MKPFAVGVFMMMMMVATLALVVHIPGVGDEVSVASPPFSTGYQTLGSYALGREMTSGGYGSAVVDGVVHQ